MTSRVQNTGRRATDAEIDRAIDVVARQMTEGSAADEADFRRRVLARIGAGRPPRTNWRAAWVFSPLAVAAAIVMAIFVARGFQPRDRGPERAAPQEAVTRSAAPQPPTVSPEQFPVRLKPDATIGEDTAVRAVTNRAATNRDEAAPALPFGTEAIEALAAPSLDLVPLAIDALAPDSIQLERLDTISPITVAPIDITDAQRRDQ